MKDKISMNFFRLILIIAALITLSCEDEDEDGLLGNWIERSDFRGIRRSNTVSFVIDNKAYVGTGYNGQEDEYYQDFYQYDVNIDSWTSIDTFPGTPRTAAVAFSVGGKGYVGLGFDGDDELKDFYVFDPNQTKGNQWTRIADFGGTARRNAVAFALDGKGYVGTGDDGNTNNDFWEYDPTTNNWTEIPAIGKKKENALAFVIGDFAYVGTGSDNGALETDFWRFDASLLPNYPWKPLTDLDEEDDYEITRENATAFVMNGLGYVISGERGTVTRSVWEYDPVSDTWEEKTSIEASARRDATAFTINERGFITTGRTGSSFFDDLLEFAPFEEEDEDD